jgi:beta-ribofuranosylaminobenzene 5'-phosphate synthase
MIKVEASARLHLGMIDLHGGLGRKYGSIGVAIQKPRVVVEATPADRLVVEGADRQRTAADARRFLDHYAPNSGAHLRVIEAIPTHVGLGSGTQLALTVGVALNHLLGLGQDVANIATIMGRGGRSGAGIGTFTVGGFVVDGGSRLSDPHPSHPLPLSQWEREEKGEGLPPTIFHHPFPEDWTFVIAIPAVARGLSGADEEDAFAHLPPPPPELPAQISRLLVMKLLPALVEHDIDSFGQALTEVQHLVGDSFATAQGGRFAHPVSEDVIRLMLAAGAKGAGQSSWGPTVYSLSPNRPQAEQLATVVREFLATKTGGDVFVTAAANTSWRLTQ